MHTKQIASETRLREPIQGTLEQPCVNAEAPDPECSGPGASFVCAGRYGMLLAKGRGPWPLAHSHYWIACSNCSLAQSELAANQVSSHSMAYEMFEPEVGSSSRTRS